MGIYEEHGNLIAALRSEGRTLQQVGDRLGVTRERVRQVLREHFPDCTLPPSTEEAAKTLGMSHYRFRSAARRLGVQPMGRSRGRVWWSPDVLHIIQTSQEPARCCICGGLLPSGRRVYCSVDCLSEGRRLRYPMRKRGEMLGLHVAPGKEG